MTPAPDLMSVSEYFRTPVTVLPQELAYGVLRAAEAPLARHQSAVDTRFTRQAPIVSAVLPDFRRSLNEILEA